MPSIAITVENLSKRYRVGQRVVQKTFGETLGDALKRPFDFARNKAAGGNHPPKTILALNDICFEVRTGETLGIVGRNGSGKSTLLKILSKITRPTSGRAVLNGRVGSLLEVGIGFHPELTGRENIHLYGAILGMSRGEVTRKFDEIVAFSELDAFIETPVKRYSSGMYMRLAFAVAAHLEPEILVVDEVLAVGDAQFQKKCLGKMSDFTNEGRTVLFVSHNMVAIKTLCKRGLLLDAGRIVFDGDVKEATSRYSGVTNSDRISVDNCARRGGSGGIRIRHVWISNSREEATNTLVAGEKASITMEADVQKEFQNGKKIVAGFGIDTLDGGRLLSCLSSWAQREIITGGEKIVLRCTLPSLPLVADKYLISAVIIFRGATLDYVEHCGFLEIVLPAESVCSEGRNVEHGYLEIPYDFEVVDV